MMDIKYSLMRGKNIQNSMRKIIKMKIYLRLSQKWHFMMLKI